MTARKSGMPQLSKAYEPAGVEERWYERWLESGVFRADATADRPGFAIVIPPPNVTGVLTLGHVLNNTIQDILCRKARMDGREVLWLPGTDHAGLATQTAVEKALRKPDELPEGVRATLESLESVWDRAAGKPRMPLTRQSMPREALLALVWAWTKDRGGTIIQQLKRLGCSCDWSRERFTMDAGYERAVLEAFVELHRRGYIYRGLRMVNWCPASLTAISDEEVIPTAQKSRLFTMRYEVAEEPGTFLEIATTRPETLMGDTAVAVHPKDERYRRFIGKHCWRPFPREKIPIIADEHIDPEFGTGVLKVTPAHDKADFEIGQRHNLPVHDVLHPDGRIHCPAVPELDGLDRFEARKRAVEMLLEQGLLTKEEPYENNVGFSERGQVPIEPRLSEQWFLDYRKMGGGHMIEEAVQVVRDGLIRFHPPHWEKVYGHWLENIMDWCLSRQVVWGHQIPVWTRGEEVRCQIEAPGAGWERDPDSLDTWASSWLWAYATMGEAERRKFYPTDVLVTGPDIIFLWVARMIIAGLEFKPGQSARAADNIPFRDVFFTGLIRDKAGKKMSKSLGNSPDPIALIEKYGADGLRFGLMRIAPKGQDIRFDENQIVEGRNFCNKLWNACRFRQMQGPLERGSRPDVAALSLHAKAMLYRLNECIRTVNRAFETFSFNEIAQALYDFVWGDFCDWFIEASKADLTGDDAARRAATLRAADYAIWGIVRLMHPFAPFITEELAHGLGLVEESETIQRAPWPEPDPAHEFGEESRKASVLYEAVSRGRMLRAECNLASNKKLAWLIRPRMEWVSSERRALETLLNAESLEFLGPKARPPKTASVALTELGEIYLPLEGLIDFEKERKRLEKELDKVMKDLQSTEAKLANPEFSEKVPADVLEEHEARGRRLKERRKQLEERLNSLEV